MRIAKKVAADFVAAQMIWQPARRGFTTTSGPTTISVNCVPNHTYTEVVWYFYASTVIDAKNSRVYLSPTFYDTPDAAQVGAERWLEKQQ